MAFADLRKLELLIEKVRNQMGKAHISAAAHETGRADAPVSIAFSAGRIVHRVEIHANVLRPFIERGDNLLLVKEIRQGFVSLDNLLLRTRATETSKQERRTGEDRRCGWDRRARPGESALVERRTGRDRRFS